MNNQRQTIGGRDYSFGVIPATEAVRVEVAVAKVIGEPLFKAFTSGNIKGEKLSTEDMRQVGMMAMGQMAAKMDPDELLKTMDTCLKYVSCDAKRIDSIDSHFTGRNRELWEVFIASLQVNFADFLPASLFSSHPAQTKV